ncbi:MAG: oligoendopeptidase F [Oscillospiraceae bacterium]|nr:oligoendopeptidase F [Oscillospiraceae bacterium]
MSEPMKRCEIEEKYKWKLEDIFPCEEEWEAMFEKVKKRAQGFAERSGKCAESAKQLLSSLQELDEIGEALLSVIAYASMRRDEDNGISKHRAMADRANDLASEVMGLCSFFEPELIAAGREKIDSFIGLLPQLLVYNQFFDNLFREAEHILDSKSEMLLAMSSPMSETGHDVFSAMNNADIRFGEIVGEDGEKEELTHSRYALFMESENRDVRRNAYNAMYEQYKKYKNTFAAMYAGNVKSDLFYAKVRGFTSSLAMKLSDSAVSEAVYSRLIDDVNEGLCVLGEYLRLRKDALGVAELCMYDLYTPIVSEDRENIPYEEACELVLAAVAPLGEEYVSDMRRAFSERWVDVYENRGKTSGAYSWGDNTNHPFVLMNYQGTIEDVFTLAHEMGHAMHSFYTNKTQPPVYRDYKIFVAEVASTVNENLLLEYLLRDATGVRRAYLLGRKAEAIRTTFYRQTMFAEFEKCAHALYMNGTPLTAEQLCESYGEINRKYYGAEAVCDENISYEWARIPHFYTSFYVYQYATGFAAATRFKELIINSRECAERYLEFLRGGNSDYPLSLLKKAGVDLETSDAAKSVIADLRSAVDELKTLLDK